MSAAVQPKYEIEGDIAMSEFALPTRLQLLARSSALGTGTATRMRICLLAAQIGVSTSATAQSMPAGSQPPPMDRQKEIVLALSACPPSVASRAAVYVLDKSGYVKVRDSQNGFTAIVQHSLPTAQEPSHSNGSQ
jgi:hypothetical protein